MPPYYATYWAIGPTGPVSGDGSHHTLYWDADGAATTIAATPAETLTPGKYRVALTSTQINCMSGSIVGTSSTSGVTIASSERPGLLAIAQAVATLSAGTLKSLGTLPLDSLGALLRAFLRSSAAANPGNLTLYWSDGTEVGRIPLAADATALPITAMESTA